VKCKTAENASRKHSMCIPHRSTARVFLRSLSPGGDFQWYRLLCLKTTQRARLITPKTFFAKSSNYDVPRCVIFFTIPLPLQLFLFSYALCFQISSAPAPNTSKFRQSTNRRKNLKVDSRAAHQREKTRGWTLHQITNLQAAL
jgi:hypothetical protein